MRGGMCVSERMVAHLEVIEHVQSEKLLLGRGLAGGAAERAYVCHRVVDSHALQLR